MGWPSKKHLKPRNLAAGELISFLAQPGDRLHCRQGRMLVTVEGVHQDFDLHRGANLTVKRASRVVVEAIGGADLECLTKGRF